MTKKFWKSIIIGLIIVLPFWVWVGSEAFGATYYVSESGDASAPTTAVPADCWDMSDFNAAAATLEPGDTIYVLDTVRATMTIPESGTVGNVYTIRGDYAGHPGIISGADVMGGPWTAYTGVWSSVYDISGSADWTDVIGAPAGRNYRSLAANTDISASGSTVRITLRAASASETTVDDVAFGQKAAAGDAWDFAADPAPVNVQFSASDNVDITGGTSVTSDSFSFALDNTKDHYASFYHGAGEDETRLTSRVGYYNTSGSDESEDSTPAAYTGTTYYRYLEKIEVLVPPTGSVWQMTGVTTESEIIIIDDVVATEGADKDSLNDHEWFWASDILYVRDDTGDPDGSGVVIEAGQRDSAIYSNNKDYITIDGLIVEGTNGKAVNAAGGSSYWTLQNNTIQDTGPGDMGFFAGGTGLNITVDTNTFSEIRGTAVYLQDVTNSSIIDNTFEVCFGANSQHIFLETCTTWEILRNTFTQQGTDSPKGCVHTDKGSGGTVKYNTFEYGNWGVDINDDDVVVEYNTFGNHSGETWSTSILVGHNSDIDNQVYIHNIDTGGSTNNIYIFDDGLDSTRTGFKFYNNSFYGATSHGIWITSPIDGEFKNNIVWASPTNEIYRINQIAGGGSWVSDYNDLGAQDTDFIYYVDTNYSTLAAYVAAKSQDPNSINADPLFTNAAGGDFTLKYNSPCEDAGTDLGATYDDIFDPRDTTFPYDTVDQDSYGSGWEIGAFAYLGGLSGIVKDWDGNILTGGAKIYAYEISVAAEVATVLDQGYIGSATSDVTTGVWMIDNITEDEYLVIFEYYGSYGGESKIAGAEFMDSIDIGVP